MDKKNPHYCEDGFGCGERGKWTTSVNRIISTCYMFCKSLD